MTDILLILWFGLTLAGAIWMAYDLYTHTPAMNMMKPGWILVALYAGPIGVLAYVLTCRQPGVAGDLKAHDAYIKPLWRQAMGSLVHCLAGDATGVIFAASLASLMGWVGLIDAALEYAFGFLFGLFIFQALFMKSMLGGYWLAVRKTVYVEWVSMNWVMAGMIPVVIIGKSMMPAAEHVTSPDYWLVMQIGAIVGLMLGYPVNYWLVGKGLKHGMMTQRDHTKHEQSRGHTQHAQHKPANHHSIDHAHHKQMQHDHHGMHGHTQPTVSTQTLCLVATCSVVALAVGIAIAVLMTSG